MEKKVGLHQLDGALRQYECVFCYDEEKGPANRRAFSFQRAGNTRIRSG